LNLIKVKIEKLVFILILQQKLEKVSIDVFDKESIGKALIGCYILYSILSGKLWSNMSCFRVQLKLTKLA
jgi:hypothetical protein